MGTLSPNPRGLSLLFSLEREKGQSKDCPFQYRTQVTARVAPQHCPILLLGKLVYIISQERNNILHNLDLKTNLLTFNIIINNLILVIAVRKRIHKIIYTAPIFAKQKPYLIKKLLLDDSIILDYEYISENSILVL